MPWLLVAVTVQEYVFVAVTPATAMATAADPACVALLVTPPFAEVQVAVNLVIGAPLFAPA